MTVKNLNKQGFDNEIRNKSGVALVDFYADWCGPCKMVAPVVEEIANERADITVGKVNVDNNIDLAGEFKVRSIPTLIVFKDGEIINKAIGYKTKAELLALLNK